MQLKNVVLHLGLFRGEIININRTKIISPLQGFLQELSILSVGCASLHRRLCTSRPAGLGQKTFH
jgi:hypothetical protein